MNSNKNFVPFTVQIDFLWDKIFEAGILFSSPKKWNRNQANFVYREYGGFFFTMLSPELCFDNQKKYFFSRETQKIMVGELKVEEKKSFLLYYPTMAVSLSHGSLQTGFSTFDRKKEKWVEVEFPLTAISEFYGNPFEQDEKDISKSLSKNGWSKNSSQDGEFNHKFFQITCKRV